MSSRLTLTLSPTLGNKTVEIDSKRFSIGRTPENDLTIEDTSLSRRHALIENFEGHFNLTDCGSSNGTFVNGRQITGSTELSDWDVLTFGGIGDILVRIQADSQVADHVRATNSSSGSFTPQAVITDPQGKKSISSGDYSSLSKPVIAVAATVVILLVTGLVLLISHGSNSRGTSNSLIKKQQRTTNNDNDDVGTSNDSLSSPTNDSLSSPTVGDSGAADSGPSNSGVESVELSTVEAYASKVLTGISRDTRPVLMEKPVAAINAHVQGYKGSSSLQEELRAMKRALPQVSALARTNGVRIPMAVYATLARIDKDGGRGDPVQVAAVLCPALARMRAVFGDEVANDSLLSVAALEEGVSLQSRITKLAGRVNDSPTTIRSIWYLHDHQVITDQTYNFVLRFMTIGVIAQDPRKFGISAEPLF